MSPYLQQLCQLAARPSRRIIGLMSGTSMDGLDVALCHITGSGPATQVTLEQFTTVPFPDAIKDRIRQVFARRDVDLQHLTLLNPWLGLFHGELVLDCLDRVDAEPTREPGPEEPGYRQRPQRIERPGGQPAERAIDQVHHAQHPSPS